VTLRTRLTAAFLAVVLGPLLVGTALLSVALPAAFAERQAREVTSAGRLAATVVAQRCAEARAVAEAVGRAVAVPERAGRQAAAESFVTRGLVQGVRVDLGGGTITAGELSDGLADGRGDCATGRPPAGEPVQISASVQLQASTGPDVGTATAALEAGRPLAAALRAAVGFGEVALVAGDEVLASSRPAGAPAPELVRRAVAARGTAVHGDGLVAAAVPPAPGQPIGVLVVHPESRGVAVLPSALAVVAGAVLLATAIALMLARATTRPLEELGDAAARVAAGDLSTTLEVRSRDEVGRLATAFNAMTQDLRRYVGALESSRDEVQTGITRLGETLSSTHDLDGIVAVVLDTAIASTSAQAGAVLLVEDVARGGPAGRLRLVVGRGVEERGAPRDLRLPFGVGIAGRVAQDDEPARGWVGDRLPAGPGEPQAESVLAVPLRSSGAVVGVLTLYDRPGGFDEADLKTIRSFAGQATVAIDNVLLHDEARRQSLTDDLTGLGNYRAFVATVHKEIERATRFDRPLALLMLDLDHFKVVNDTYGHPRGDAVLTEIARRLREQVRDVDTLARYGGEEIVAVLPETDEEGAAQAAERLRETVAAAPFLSAGQPPVRLTVSVGAAVFPAHGATAATLLAAADDALYDAKRAGRNTWRLAGDSAPPTPVPVADSDPH
jgi:two-component system cell cycle response regulator